MHCNPRFIRLLLLVSLCSFLAVTYYYLKNLPPYELYNRLSEQEIQDSRLLGETTSVSGGGQRKYVKFRQLRGAGFNNQVQDILLYHNLALASSRTYVYQPFIWRPRGEKSQVPLSAFLPGVTKISISSVAFERICPEKEIVHVKLGGVTSERQWDHAVSVLSGEDRCVEVDDWIFNWTFLTTPGLHAVWPSFLKYLTSHFEWSQTIVEIVERVQTKFNLRSDFSTTDRDPYITLHLRRGDFESHCSVLAERHVGFTTWATLPELETSILSPPLDTTDTTSVLMHCYPSLHRILSAVTIQARLHPTARTLYVLHDGAIDHPGVYLQYYKLREAFMNDEWAMMHHWPGGAMRRVLHSGDGGEVRKWGESDYGVAVDVELARRAEGFVGNGYSSLSTQIVALRMADGRGAVNHTFV